jgi:hypothetical protein
MLSLTGTIRAAVTLPGRTDRKTGEVSPPRDVLQIEGQDNRGLVQLYTLTVPNRAPFLDKVGEVISVPVRAWAPGATVGLSYEGSK